MLDIKCEEMLEHDGLKQVLKDFRRVQVSRFPIIASCRTDSIQFYDSRFSNGKQIACVDIVVDTSDSEGGKDQFCLASRLIVNDRFVRGNDRKHQKHTKDPKKLLRYMRDYVKPFSAKEIAANSIELRREHLMQWRGEAQSLMRDLCNIDRDDVMEEIVRMQAIGYQPQTEKFAKVVREGLAAWEEHKRRINRSVMNVHVFINPDESVEIFCPDKMGYAGLNQGVNSFDSLAGAPNCVQQHVAMLRMMEDKAFVAEVGTKINATNYWVEVYPE